MAIRVTQLGNEVWVINPSNIRVTQLGNEVWILPAGGKVRVTQAGLEVWRTDAGEPLAITGNADGQGSAYAIEARSIPVAGQADGYATAQSTLPFVSPIIAVMAI